MFFHDLVFQFLQGLALASLVRFMKGSIAVEPLAVGDGIKFLQEASHPLARFLVGVDAAEVSGLNHTPLFGWESEEEVVPTN